jgi:hypothetical protein
MNRDILREKLNLHSPSKGTAGVPSLKDLKQISVKKKSLIKGEDSENVSPDIDSTEDCVSKVSDDTQNASPSATDISLPPAVTKTTDNQTDEGGGE